VDSLSMYGDSQNIFQFLAHFSIFDEFGTSKGDLLQIGPLISFLDIKLKFFSRPSKVKIKSMNEENNGISKNTSLFSPTTIETPKPKNTMLQVGSNTFSNKRVKNFCRLYSLQMHLV
jgi:hypothetical protein